MDIEEVHPNVEVALSTNATFLQPYTILYLLIGLLEITTNIIIVCVIAKHKSLQTPTYAYILNWSLINILFVVDLIYFYGLHVPTVKVLHISYELEAIVQLCTITLLTFLLFNFATKGRTCSKTINIILSCSTLPAFLICHMFNLLILFQMSYLVFHCVVFFVVAHTLIKYQLGSNEKVTDIHLFRICVVTIYLALWISCYGAFDVVTYLHGFHPMNVGLLNLCVGLNNSVIALVVLCTTDGVFRVHLLELFSCVNIKYICGEKFEKLEEICDENELFI